ncbi:unnamed protein product [Mytilus coruscus]|uniref:Uncharacterized protein n=1 Tax=Mytilus coruscus TaxID=42192 RepID=A0A6J8CKF7_MYTCO|nr:unnamed protein product [Mytilus coruscus]
MDSPWVHRIHHGFMGVTRLSRRGVLKAYTTVPWEEKKGSKTDQSKPISVRDEILVLDKPIYMAKFADQTHPVILRSEEGGTYTVCSVKDTGKRCWVVPQLFHLAKDEQRKVHGPSRPKTPDASTTSSKKATDQNEAGTSHSQEDAVGLTKSKESDSDFEKPHKSGKHEQQSQEQIEVTNSVAKHNKFSESVFAYLDGLMRYKPHIKTLSAEAFVMFSLNKKTGEWLESKDTISLMHIKMSVKLDSASGIVRMK